MRRFFLLLLLATTLSAADWPQWMGPQRDGVWREDGLAEKFPDNGPPVVWTHPAYARGRAFVRNNSMVRCLDLHAAAAQ